MGRLTAKPEVNSAKGTNVGHFTVAVNRPKREGKDDEADFIRVTVFGKTAENAEKYLDKGSSVFVTGRIQTGRYENKDGDNVNTCDVIADSVKFLKDIGSSSFNEATLIGRLTADPEISYTATNNTCVAKFTLAVDRPKRNGEDKGADFIRTTVFGKTAENIEKYISKGRQIAVTGPLQLGSFENKEKKKVYIHDVIAGNVEFLGSGNGNSAKKADDLVDLPDGIQDSWDWDENPSDDEF